MRMTREMAYRRDASFNRSGRGGSYRYHFEGDRGGSACGKVPLLDDSTGAYVDSVPENLRCRAAGCAQHWPKQ